MSTSKRREGSSRKLILGLDVSLNGTGWAVVEVVGGRPKALVACGEIKNTSKESHGKRLRKIREELAAICRENEIREIAKEKGFSWFHKETQALFKAHGVADEFFADFKINEYAATTIKKAITDNGKASKDQVQQSIRSILGLSDSYKFPSDNASDAAAVAATHAFK